MGGDVGGPGKAGMPGGFDPSQLKGLAGALGLGGAGNAAGGAGSPAVGGAARDGGGSGAADKTAPIVIHGEGRPAGPNTTSEPATVAIDSTGLTIQIGSGRPMRAAFRDLSVIAIQQATALLVLGEGPDAMRFILEKFADRLGPMVRLLRELRLKQRLTDGLVKVPDDPAELLEFAWKPTQSPLGPGPDGPAAATSGVGQLVVQPWGFVVCPLDERATWIHFRRASISTVTTPSPGDVVVDGEPGTLTLHGLGAASTRFHDTLVKLRDGALADAAGFVEELMPDAPFGVRQKASDLLVDGRPTRPDAFGDSGWPVVETAVLGEAKFADLVFSKVEGTWTFVLADKKPEIPVRVYDDMARAAQLICVKIGMYADVPLVRKRKGPWGLDRYELSPGTVADTASWVAMLQAIPAKQHCEVVRALFSVVAGLIGMADRGARR